MNHILFSIISFFMAFHGPNLKQNNQLETIYRSYEASIYADIDSDKYSMRLDFMTESQVDDIINLKKATLEMLCDKTMGCNSRSTVVLSKGDKIQLFKDDRISSVELIRVNSDSKTIIAHSISNKKGSYIIVPEEINRENIEHYMIHIL